MTPKEFAKKIIASINPGTADISGIGDGTIKGAISEQNKKLTEYKVYYYDSSESLTANSFIHSSIPLELLNGYTIDDIVSINVECTNALWCRITGSIYRPNHIAITNYAIRDCESPKYRITLGFCKVK